MLRSMLQTSAKYAPLFISSSQLAKTMSVNLHCCRVQIRGDFGAHPSEMLLHWRWLVCERLGLPVSDEPAPDKATRVLQVYRQLLLRGNLIDLLDVFMNEPEAARPNSQTLCPVSNPVGYFVGTICLSVHLKFDHTD